MMAGVNKTSVRTVEEIVAAENRAVTQGQGAQTDATKKGVDDRTALRQQEAKGVGVRNAAVQESMAAEQRKTANLITEVDRRTKVALAGIDREIAKQQQSVDSAKRLLAEETKAKERAAEDGDKMAEREAKVAIRSYEQLLQISTDALEGLQKQRRAIEEGANKEIAAARESLADTEKRIAEDLDSRQAG